MPSHSSTDRGPSQNGTIPPDSELTSSEEQYIKDVVARQQDFNVWLAKHGQITAEQSKCFHQQDLSDAAQYWADIARQGQNVADDLHAHGLRHWARSAQSKAAAASTFIQTLQPLVNLAASTAPCGGLAIGVVSGLFAIAWAKDTIDRSIVQAMAGVMDRLPTLDMLKQIYNQETLLEARLRAKMTVAWGGIVDLSIIAAQHCLQSGTKRWLKAFGRPEGFQQVVRDVQDKISAVRVEAEGLLTVVIDRISQQNSELLRNIAQLQQEAKRSRLEIQKFRSEQNRHQIADLQRSLRTWPRSDQEQQKSLQYYERTLQEVHDTNPQFTWMSPSVIEEMRCRPELAGMFSNQSSYMLVLVGKNHTRMPRHEHAWVSPFAVNLIQSRRAKTEALAYYIFDSVGPRDMHTCVAEILIQMAVALPSLDLPKLRTLIDIYQDHLKDAKSPAKDTNCAKSLQKAAVLVATHLHEACPFWLIIDRLDACDRPEQRLMLRLLHGMVESAVGTLKVLVTANDFYWKVEDHHIEDLVTKTTFHRIVEIQDTLPQSALGTPASKSTGFRSAPGSPTRAGL
ncbi:hypothetical protein BDZ85DRAFT_254201 [Elsinoe ampelina]|uniref:Uncharacterized protein n=1 Tax=Elsinoe ampelina TaxID=302913 RepID=A0A6A6GNX7_9PEZI|nr:hypothetical protein BDZ85DRAFT_254201 [Elsinoe ampelina]